MGRRETERSWIYPCLHSFFKMFDLKGTRLSQYLVCFCLVLLMSWQPLWDCGLWPSLTCLGKQNHHPLSQARGITRTIGRSQRTALLLVGLVTLLQLSHPSPIIRLLEAPFASEWEFVPMVAVIAPSHRGSSRNSKSGENSASPLISHTQASEGNSITVLLMGHRCNSNHNPIQVHYTHQAHPMQETVVLSYRENWSKWWRLPLAGNLVHAWHLLDNFSFHIT